MDENTLATGEKGVFAGGDVATGPGSIIHAIAHGRKAASAIDRFLGGDGDIEETLARPEKQVSLPPFTPGSQAPIPHAPSESGQEGRRIPARWSRASRRSRLPAETNRCLQCDARRFEVVLNTESCKECGYCAEVCGVGTFGPVGGLQCQGIQAPGGQDLGLVRGLLQVLLCLSGLRRGRQGSRGDDNGVSHRGAQRFTRRDWEFKSLRALCVSSEAGERSISGGMNHEKVFGNRKLRRHGGGDPGRVQVLCRLSHHAGHGDRRGHEPAAPPGGRDLPPGRRRVRGHAHVHRRRPGGDEGHDRHVRAGLHPLRRPLRLGPRLRDPPRGPELRPGGPGQRHHRRAGTGGILPDPLPHPGRQLRDHLSRPQFGPGVHGHDRGGLLSLRAFPHARHRAGRPAHHRRLRGHQRPGERGRDEGDGLPGLAPKGAPGARLLSGHRRDRHPAGPDGAQHRGPLLGLDPDGRGLRHRRGGGPPQARLPAHLQDAQQPGPFQPPLRPKSSWTTTRSSSSSPTGPRRGW